MNDTALSPQEGILHHPEGVDLVPANIELSGLEVSLVNVMSREKILKQYLDDIKSSYDYILIDCMPSLGMLTVNTLAARRQCPHSCPSPVSVRQRSGATASNHQQSPQANQS